MIRFLAAAILICVAQATSRRPDPEEFYTGKCVQVLFKPVPCEACQGKKTYSPSEIAKAIALSTHLPAPIVKMILNPQRSQEKSFLPRKEVPRACRACNETGLSDASFWLPAKVTDADSYRIRYSMGERFYVYTIQLPAICGLRKNGSDGKCSITTKGGENAEYWQREQDKLEKDYPNSFPVEYRMTRSAQTCPDCQGHSFDNPQGCENCHDFGIVEPHCVCGSDVIQFTWKGVNEDGESLGWTSFIDHLFTNTQGNEL